MSPVQIELAENHAYATSSTGCYEIHVPTASLYAAYQALRQAGAAEGLQLFGARAVESMRLEKSFLHWKADLLTEFDPFEAGLRRFVRLEKGDFLGRAALLARQAAGPQRQLVPLRVESETAPARGGASLMQGARVVGTVTSGGWGHRVGLNLALAYVEPELARLGSRLMLDLCGELVPAEVIEPSPYDPQMLRVRQA